MQRFVFTLERVLKYKERRERLAEMRQLRALATLRTCEAVVATLRDRWQEAGALLPGGTGRTLDVAAWLAHFRHVERLARELAAAEHQVREAARRVEEAAALRRQQAREAEALRQLRRRQHEEYWRQAAKAEQRFLDEQGLRRWQQPEAAAQRGEEGIP